MRFIRQVTQAFWDTQVPPVFRNFDNGFLKIIKIFMGWMLIRKELVTVHGGSQQIILNDAII